MTPSGLAISSGQGHGWAQDLGRSSFDPVAFVKGIADERQLADLNRAKTEADRINRNRKFLTELKPTEVNQWNLDEIEKEMQTFEKTVLDLAQKGVDLEDSPEGRKALNEGRARILALQNEGKQIAEAQNHYRKMLAEHPDKYDAEELKKWEEGLEAQVSIQDRAKYIQTAMPFKATFDANAFLDDMVQATPIEQIERAGRLYEGENPEKAKEVLFSGMDNMMLSPQGKAMIADTVQQAYDAGVITEPTVDAYKDALWKQMVSRLESSVKRAPDRGNGGGGGGSTSGAIQPTASTSPSYSKYGGVNQIMFSQKGKDIAPVSFSNYKGESEFMKPEMVVFKKNRKGEDQWYIVGKKAKRTTGDQIEREAKAKGMSIDAFMAQRGWEKDPETPNEFVSIKETETIEVPVSSQSGSYGEANYRKISEMMGEDFYEFIKRQNAGKTTGKTTGGGQVTDVSNIFGGQ